MKTMAMQAAAPSPALDAAVRDLARRRLAARAVAHPSSAAVGGQVWVRLAVAASLAVAGALVLSVFLRPTGERTVMTARLGASAPAAEYAAGTLQWDFDATGNLNAALLAAAVPEAVAAPRLSALDESLLEAELSLIFVETEKVCGTD